MDSAAKRHFFSIAPEFGIYDIQLDQTYHYTSYQLCLQSAARALGHDFCIVAPTTCSIDSADVIPLLSPPPCDGLSSNVVTLIDNLCLVSSDKNVVILLYEGSIDLAYHFLTLAKRFPSIQFIINLFLSEPYFNLNSEFGSRLNPGNSDIPSNTQSPIQSFYYRGKPQVLPANLHILTESESKGFVARTLGMTDTKQWQTFSAIFDLRRASPNRGRSTERIQVLLPLSSWQIDEHLVNNIISVKKDTERCLGSNFNLNFHVTGYLSGDEVKQLLARLRSAGFKVTSKSRSKEEYAEMIYSHDVVWLPNRYYILQSSGKALDALVQGTPIIAPLGTYGWGEQNRWVTGAPGYSTTEEARDIFVNLKFILPIISLELKTQNRAIRDYYSPTNTVLNLVSELEK